MSTQKHDYHIVDPSPMPIYGVLSASILVVGTLLFMHDKPHGGLVIIAGFAAVFVTMFYWWKDVVNEGLSGENTILN